MPTLKQRIQAFFNPPALTPGLTPTGRSASPTGGEGSQIAPVISESSVATRFQVEHHRAAVVKDCRIMYKTDPRIKKMHKDYAKDLMRNGFIVRTEDARAKQIADDLQNRLKLNQKLEDWLRLSMRDGDSFLELSVDDSLLISDVTRKPTLQ